MYSDGPMPSCSSQEQIAEPEVVIVDGRQVLATNPIHRSAIAHGPPTGETMNQAVTLFVSTFTTLLAIINPLESLPVLLPAAARQGSA